MKKALHIYNWIKLKMGPLSCHFMTEDTMHNNMTVDNVHNISKHVI